MKTVRSRMSQAAVMIALAAIMAPQMVMALTEPCTPISNQAELTYSVGGVDQTNAGVDPVLSGTAVGNTDPTTFNVGVKILVTVAKANAGYVTVTPSDQASGKRWLSYTVTNNGNATHQYDFSQFAAADDTLSPFGVVVPDDQDTFDANLAKLAIYAESSAASDVPATYDAYDYLAGIDTGTTLTLAPGMTNKVYIVYTPDTLFEPINSIAVQYLKAMTKWANGDALPAFTGGNATGTPSAVQAGGACDGSISIDIVAGDADGDDGELDDNDGARDGAHIAKNAFKVSTAVIEHTKAYYVSNQGIAGVTCTENYVPPANNNDCKEIPGATVTYRLTIQNTGDASATLSTYSDLISDYFELVTTAGSATYTFDGTPTDKRADGVLQPGTSAALTLTTGLGAPADSRLNWLLGDVANSLLPAVVGASPAGRGELRPTEKITLTFQAEVK